MNFLKLAFTKRKLIKGETPESFFDHFQGAYAFCLKSSNTGRYSYLSYDPFLICTSNNGNVFLQKKHDFLDFKKSSVPELVEGDSFEVLRNLFKNFVFKDKAPVPFFGGAFGYFSYDFGCNFMEVEQKVFDDLHLPDFVFSFVDKMIAFDHEMNEVYFLALAETDLKAKQKLKQIESDLNQAIPFVSKGKIGDLESNLSFDKYAEKISKIKELITEGQTYQVNFSQRFYTDCTFDSWDTYKKLVNQNVGSFSFYFDCDDFKILSISPELLLRKRGGDLETWPIKGTISRGKNLKQDELQIEKLLSSKKDEAELNMITDLERSDMGKVSVPGSVEVVAEREVQKYTNVIHTVSRVISKLDPKKDFFDAFKAMFPGGSITGCPKKRTMEIIDQLEDYKRGIYTGSAGFINFSGDSDFNILIRTALMKDDKIYFSSGGGIVYDSDPKIEYEETLAKAKSFIDLI